jgi:hypothetical protein
VMGWKDEDEQIGSPPSNGDTSLQQNMLASQTLVN